MAVLLAANRFRCVLSTKRTDALLFFVG